MSLTRVAIAIAVAAVALLGGCELFIDLDDDEPDAATPDVPDATPIFDAATLACQADSRFIDVGVTGSRYRLVGSGLSFQVARSRCQTDGAELASVNDSGEFDAIEGLIASVPIHPSCNGEPCAWVGLFQGSATSLPDEGWSWPDGTSANQPWAIDQPDDGDDFENGVEQCATLKLAGLDDVPCDTQTFSVCECPLSAIRRP